MSKDKKDSPVINVPVVKSKLINPDRTGNGNTAFYTPESNYPRARKELKLGAIKNLIDHIKDVYSPTGSMVAVNVVGTIASTKDGSSLFDSMVFEDPVSLLVHGLIRQGSEYILRNSKDGTTSVALLSCLLAERLIEICSSIEEAGHVVSKQKVKDISLHISNVYMSMVKEKRVLLNLSTLKKDDENYNLIMDVCRTSMNDDDTLTYMYREILDYIIDNKVEPKDITFRIREESVPGKSELKISRAYKIATVPMADKNPFSLTDVPVLRLDDPFVMIDDTAKVFEFAQRLIYAYPNGAVVMMGVIPPGFKEYHASFITNVRNANLIKFIHQPLIGEGNHEISDLDRIVGGINFKILEIKSESGVIKSAPTLAYNEFTGDTVYINKLKEYFENKRTMNVAFNGTHVSFNPSNGDFSIFDEMSSDLEKQLDLVENRESESYVTLKGRIENLKSFWFDTVIRCQQDDERGRLRSAYDDATGALISAITEGLVSGGNTFLVKYLSKFIERVVSGFDDNLIPSPKYRDIAMDILSAYVSAYYDLMELIYGEAMVDDIWNTLKDCEDPLKSYDILRDVYSTRVLEPAMTTVVVNHGATLSANSINSIARVKGLNLDHSAQLNQFNKYTHIQY